MRAARPLGFVTQATFTPFWVFTGTSEEGPIDNQATRAFTW